MGYPPVHEQDNPEPQFAEVELENITYCISNGKLFVNEDPLMIVQNIHKITYCRHLELTLGGLELMEQIFPQICECKT